MEELKYKTESEYEAAMIVIDELMRKGEADLSAGELEKIRVMAVAAQAYEMEHYYIEAPQTFQGMIERRMYEFKLNQQELAKKLGVSNAKLSLILNGKQRPDIPFIKAVHTELNVPADFILDHI
ncbi:helix-turn-helix domain-containing protein [Dyadobacter luticola]|uniref:Helix-turn-helix domain-containing protein n=1 Tax=Dyadobacter luticola TaxID=1979387 RepID=A0A5R9KQ66_9BACT|nr:helix-turn-helix domain-containing protein [Dyadobacter luticola]TLU98254.1 helix-turn-helix domain-containing protein [Dyadobacter luticola]